MKDRSTYGDFNSDDIRRYLEGRMSPEEMHRMEKAALDDPFLADAMEGYQLNPDLNVKSDIAELKARLTEKTLPSEKSSFGWWRIAAMFILVLGASTAAWYLSRPAVDINTLAKNEELRPLPHNDSPTQIMPGLLPADTAVTDNRNRSKQEEAIANTEKDKTIFPGKTDIKSAGQPVIAADTVQVNKDQSMAAIEKEKQSKEKSEPGKISPAPKEPDISAAGRQSIPSKAEPLIEKNADVRNLAPASSDIARTGPAAKESGTIPSYYFRGRVTDINNKPVPYASVRISNSVKGWYTDVQGRFSLVSSDSIIKTEIVSVGYNSKKISLTATPDPAVIRLETSSTTLSEVVVPSGKSRANKEADQSDSKEEKNKMIYAEPADGWSLYEIYIKNNLRVPVTHDPSPLKGAVTVSFYVNPDNGLLSDFRIEKSLGIQHDKEAIRVLKEGPPWDVFNSNKGVRANFTILY